MNALRYYLLIFICSLILHATLQARVLRVEIESREPVLNGKLFGQYGAYELLKGTVYYSFDPNNAYNQRITDIRLAPVNAEGLVEARGDLVVLQPIDPDKRRGTALVEVSNRGGKFTPSYFNQATKSRELLPNDPDYWGDGLTMEEGLTVIWIGWQFDVPSDEHSLNFITPTAKNEDGTAIEGWVRSDWTVDEPINSLNLGHNGQQPYPAVRPDSDEHQLTVRDGRDAPRLPVASSAWQFGPRRLTIEMPDGFQAGKIYELVYRAKDPAVVGLGPAAIRDIIAYAKYDPTCPFPVERGLAAGVSQTGRFLRYFLYKGFNTDEGGRQAYDGILSITAGGGRGSFNHRFAQPSRDAHRYSAFFYPTDIFPFAMAAQTDAVVEETDGILQRLFDPEHAPKIFQVNSGYEYWGRSASLIHTTPDGQSDLELLPNERIYHLASGQHYVDRWPPRQAYGDGAITAYQGDPLEFRPNYRALLLHLVRWVEDTANPPESRYPRLSDGTLVPKEAVNFPKLPGISLPTVLQRAYRVDYGPRWQEAGIVDLQPPKLGYGFSNLVPQVDSLGNELSGIRNLEIRVPVATYTPWSLRLGVPANQHELNNFRGLFIPLLRTEAERVEKKDPRPSLSRLYPSVSAYETQVQQALDELITDGFVLARDREFLTERAQTYWDWITDPGEPAIVTEGPKNGTLIVIGGGRLDSEFYQKFQKLAGGPDAPIVIIPTANSDEGLALDPDFERLKQRFREEGFTNISVRHTRDPKEADTEAFTEAIRKASGVWFPGGRQWRLADSYLGTATHKSLKDLLNRGGVIAGTSAGATIQGSYLARGDTRTNTLMMGDHEEGLGFISNIAIDQHLLARNRQFDLFEILEHRPELLGIGLDENTGIVVQGDEFEVIGASYAAIYDGKKWSRERRAYFPLGKGDQRFYLLPSGARYNMRERRVVEGR